MQVSKERTLHTEFVDCVRWVGNLVMSKAGNGDEDIARQERVTLPPNKILLWDPLELEEPDTSNLRPREVSTHLKIHSGIWSVTSLLSSESTLLPPNRFLLWDPLELEEPGTSSLRPRDVSVFSTVFRSTVVLDIGTRLVCLNSVPGT